LASTFGLVEDSDYQEAEGAHAAGTCRWQSFGELPAESVRVLPRALVDILRGEAVQAEEQALQLSGDVQKQEARNFNEQFDELLARYATEAEEEDLARQTSGGGEDPEAVQARQAQLAAVRARATRCRAVADRVEALVPCLEDDEASARLVLALALVTVDHDEGFASAASFGEESPVADAATSGSSLLERRGFRAPFAALSTADACWALSSEKRRMIMDKMLPSVTAESRWFWPHLRRTGICWWLCGAGVQGIQAQPPELELLDGLVTKLAQSAMVHLRHFDKTGRLLGMSAGGTLETSEHSDTCHNRMQRRLTDEAIFWFVATGTQLAKLKVLVKSGRLGNEKGLIALMEHQRSSEPDFIKKNAFKVLSMHRYHLSSALFALIGCHEEAAQIIAKHLRDPQLLLLLLRRHPEVLKEALPDSLESSSQVDDPWRHLLVAWHLGDPSAARRCLERATAAAQEQPRRQEGPAGGEEQQLSRQLSSEEAPLFGGALRLVANPVGCINEAGSGELLTRVVGTLF